MGTIRRLLRSGGHSADEESRLQSARADNLLQEFESSGKGWFWETTREGTLSYVSDSVAEALGRDPADLIDRPFTDLISTDTEEGSATSERTLGFYLSSHGCHRPARSADAQGSHIRGAASTPRRERYAA